MMTPKGNIDSKDVTLAYDDNAKGKRFYGCNAMIPRGI